MEKYFDILTTLLRNVGILPYPASTSLQSELVQLGILSDPSGLGDAPSFTFAMKPSPYFDGAKAKNEAFLNNSFKLIKYREPTDSLCPFDVPPSECKEYEREWTIQSEHVVADGKPHLYTGFEIKTPHTCTADEQVRIAHALLNGDFKNATLSSLHVTKGVQKLVKGTDVRGLYVLLEKYDALHDEWVEQFRKQMRTPTEFALRKKCLPKIRSCLRS